MKRTYILVALMILMCVGAVSAYTATTTVPAASTRYAGSITAVVTTNNPHVTQCSLWGSSASTANSTAKILLVMTNETTIAAKLNGTLDTTIIQDSADYVFYANCTNGTTAATSASVTGVIIDNTVPNTPTSTSPTSGSADDDGTVTFSASVTDANTTGCTLSFVGANPGSNQYTMSYTTTTCTLDLVLPDSQYTWLVTASDGTNLTNTAQSTVDVDVSKVSAGAKALFFNQGAEPVVQTQGILDTTGAGVEPKTVMIVLGIAALGYYLFLHKKR